MVTTGLPGADRAEEPVLGAPPIELDVEPAYWPGFPMPVAVTVLNPTAGRTWYRLPGGDLLEIPGPVEFVFRSADGRVIELPAAPLGDHEEPHDGFTLRPGESRTLLFELSEYEPELTPGPWSVEATYRTMNGTSSDAAPRSVEVVAPSREDSLGAARLRGASLCEPPSWSRFLDCGVESLPEVDLSPEAWRQVAFHEALHRVVFTLQPIGSCDPAIFLGFDSGPLAGETQLLRLEILRARGSRRSAAVTEEILARWPGLAWRVAELETGPGRIARLRAQR